MVSRVNKFQIFAVELSYFVDNAVLELLIALGQQLIVHDLGLG